MLWKFVIGAVFLLTVDLSGGVGAFAGKNTGSCCFPGADCCYPGSPCCDDCCYPGSSCCDDCCGDTPKAKSANVGAKVDCCSDPACEHGCLPNCCAEKADGK